MNARDKRDTAKMFLKSCKARVINVAENDTSRTTTYTMDVVIDDQIITEIWIENESKLEEPEYYYTLARKE